MRNIVLIGIAVMLCLSPVLGQDQLKGGEVFAGYQLLHLDSLNAYSPGELRAVAMQNGVEIASMSFHTVDIPARLRANADRISIRADRNDLAYVTVQVLDAGGNLVPDAVVPVTFSISGAGELAGVGNADPKDVESFRQPHRKTFRGRCLVVVRPRGASGSITLRAQAQGLSAATVTINVG